MVTLRMKLGWLALYPPTEWRDACLLSIGKLCIYCLEKSMYIGRAPQTSQGNVDAVRSYTNRSELEYAFHVGYPV